MEEIVPGGSKEENPMSRTESKLSDADAKTGTGAALVMKLPSNNNIQYSFEANTFEDLDKQVKEYLVDKELITITCWHDGKKHYCMLGAKDITSPPVESGQEVLVNGTAYRYRGQGTVSKDGQMILQCY